MAHTAGRCNSSPAARPFRRTVGMSSLDGRGPRCRGHEWGDGHLRPGSARSGATIRLPVPGGAPPIGGRWSIISSISRPLELPRRLSRSADLRDGPLPCLGRPAIVLWRRATNVSEVVLVPPERRGRVRRARSRRCPPMVESSPSPTRGSATERSESVHLRARHGPEFHGVGFAHPDRWDRRWRQLRPAVFAANGRIVAFTSDAGGLRGGRPEPATGCVRPRLDDGPDGARQHRRGRYQRSRDEDPAISSNGNRVAFKSRDHPEAGAEHHHQHERVLSVTG